ncbi:MAG: RES family NAD+ phosphorylase [Phycisphaerales bacterium]|nr:RES family NAD+ phosphorylase [Phycisphaerales bacterium]
MIQAWRITKAKYADTAFSGVGTKRDGGRWNNPGTSIVYTAGSTSLAILEMLVHLDEVDTLLQHYVIFEISFDKSLVKSVDPATFPEAWRVDPPPVTVQLIGDDWVAGEDSAVLRLPSAVVPAEWNYLLNPEHPDFAKIAIGPKQPIEFDPRLAKAHPSARLSARG